MPTVEAPHWETLIKECHQHPLQADMEIIQTMIDTLNTQTLQTGYEFHLQQIVDNVVPPNVAPLYHDGHEWTKPIKAEKTGDVILGVLSKLPASVRNGSDELYEAYQVRLDDFNSFEHVMGTTTLLIVFLSVRNEADACYFFPDDTDSVTNWEVLKDMHAKQFPQIGDIS